MAYTYIYVATVIGGDVTCRRPRMLPRADAGLLSTKSTITPSSQAIDRDANLAGEVAKHLAGLDHLGKASAAVLRTAQKALARELFAENASLSGSVLTNKLALYRAAVEVCLCRSVPR